LESEQVSFCASFPFTFSLSLSFHILRREIFWDSPKGGSSSLLFSQDILLLKLYFCWEERRRRRRRMALEAQVLSDLQSLIGEVKKKNPQTKEV